MNSPDIPGFEGFERLDAVVQGRHVRGRLGGRPDAPPLLLLHGFPQTHAMWHRVAPRLAPHFRLVLPDLRGYGDSDPAPDEPAQAQMGKRAMAADLRALMRQLGHERFAVAGHDRGGRVAHRLALDAPEAVARLAVLDIAPTLDMLEGADWRFGRAYYHWFFLAQPAPEPERMIAADPVRYLHRKLGGWGAASLAHLHPAALAEYERCIARPEVVHAMCEDYRAAFTSDMVADRESRAAGLRLRCELLVLWGGRGVVQALFDPMALWRAASAEPAAVQGEALDCGHYLPEEQPEATAERLLRFFSPPAAAAA
ncbi:MAG: alpha/beta fold hydrolase [Betaproteobacteria bacterium]|jgi:haloacetate dehalogenase|nr:alpha/beta hydrolase [Rubrivivax sp.]